MGTADGWGQILKGKSKRDAVVTVAGKATRPESEHVQIHVKKKKKKKVQYVTKN